MLLTIFANLGNGSNDLGEILYFDKVLFCGISTENEKESN